MIYMQADTSHVYEKDMIKTLVAEAKSKIPKWVRIMRVQREISAAEIAGNFRQTVLHYEQECMRCVCIRCREAGYQVIQLIRI